jgi:hypothetical protein
MGQAYRQTLYIGNRFYWKYDTAPIKPQAHGDPQRGNQLPQSLGKRAKLKREQV